MLVYKLTHSEPRPSPKMCSWGLTAELAVLMDPVQACICGDSMRLFECEIDIGELSFAGSLVWCEAPRNSCLMREIAVPDIRGDQAVAFGILAANDVGNDEDWTKWADRWLSGEDRTEAAAIAVNTIIHDGFPCGIENVNAEMVRKAMMYSTRAAVWFARGHRFKTFLAAANAAQSASSVAIYGRSDKELDLVAIAKEALALGADPAIIAGPVKPVGSGLINGDEGGVPMMDYSVGCVDDPVGFAWGPWVERIGEVRARRGFGTPDTLWVLKGFCVSQSRVRDGVNVPAVELAVIEVVDTDAGSLALTKNARVVPVVDWERLELVTKMDPVWPDDVCCTNIKTGRAVRPHS